MAWIEAHQELARHPKVRTVARTLNVPRPQIIGHLLCLWWWTLDVAPDGHLEVHPEDLAEEAQWDGNPTQFIDALCAAGLLHPTGTGWVVNDWTEYGGKYASKRAERAADGTWGNHQRWHVDRGQPNPDCRHCQASPPESPPESPPSAPTENTLDPIAPISPPESPRSNPGNTGFLAPTEPDENTRFGSPPESHQPTNQPTNTHPLGTHDGDAAVRLACVWTANRSPNQTTIGTARRVITECPDLATLTEPQLRRLVAWAKTGGTRTLGGVSHVAASWPDWPKTTRPRPPWCGNPDCEQTTRLRFDDDGTARPCPDCATPPEARAS